MVSDKFRLLFSFVETNNEIWGFTLFSPKFIKISMHDFTTKYIESFWEYREKSCSHYSEKILSYEGMIYSIDIGGSYILAYNIMQDEYKIIDIGMSKYSWGNFSHIFKYEKYIYLISSSSSLSKRFNMDNCKLEDIYINHGNYSQHSCGCNDNEKCYVVANNSSTVYIFDFHSLSEKKIQLRSNVHEPSHMLINNSTLWILEGNGHVFAIDTLSDKVKDVIHPLCDNPLAFSKMVFTKRSIWLLPNIGNDIVRVDLKTKEEFVYDNYPKDFVYAAPDDWSKFSCCISYKKGFLWAMRSGNYMLYVDCENDELNWYKPVFLDDARYLNYCINTGKHVFDESEIGIEEFLKKI